MSRTLIRWMDRDWSGRGYNPAFALGHRLTWGIPSLLSLAVTVTLEAAGFSHSGSAVVVVLPLGAVGTFGIMLLSLYRWAAGYCRSEFQESAALNHRRRLAALRALLRLRFKSDSR